MDNSKAVLGFLAGTAIGAILGILFAPDKGTETRRKISQKTTDTANSLKDSFNDFVDNLKETYMSASDEAQNLGEQAASTFNQAKNETRNALQP